MSEIQQMINRLMIEINRLRERLARLETTQESTGIPAAETARLSVVRKMISMRG